MRKKVVLNPFGRELMEITSSESVRRSFQFNSLVFLLNVFGHKPKNLFNQIN